MLEGSIEGCLSDEAVADLLEQRLEPSAVRVVAEHIDRCAACRRIVAEAARSVDPTGEGGGDDDDEGTPLPSGSVVGRYVVLECIGAGSMGVVYTAKDPDLGRKVALKLLRTDPRARPSSLDGRARLLREAQAMARLSHPNVITIYDVSTIDDEVFLAMELVEGGTLAEWLETPRSWRDVVGVFRRAGEGLAAAHAAGLIHRDFKPDNVLVGKDGRVRVTDFGLARAADDPALPVATTAAQPEQRVASMTRTGTLIGTPAYMAPEQLAGVVADARSDLFSFCVAFYEALYGRRPFAGGVMAELSAAIANGSIASPPARTKVPAWLRRLIVRGLHADPAQRPPNLRALLEAVDGGLSRSRLRVVLIVAAAIVACAAVAALGARRASRRAADAPGPTAPPSATAVTDVPLPASTSPEALQAYQSGLQRLRDGDVLTVASNDFARATELDPALAAAHLRYALLDFWGFPLDAREHLARAVEGRHSLSERDQRLLGAAQAWMQSQPANAAEYARLTAEALARYPLDAEFAFFAAEARDESGDRAGASALADRALTIDPRFGAAYYLKGNELAYAGDLEGALATIKECAARVANPAACLDVQNSIDALEGNCARLEQTSEQLLARDPSNDVAYWWLSNAAYARGRPRDIVSELLKQEIARVPASATSRARSELWDLWSMDVLSGDFQASLGRADELAEMVASEPDQFIHARVALWRSSAWSEVGRPAEAAGAAEEFLRRKEAWLAAARGDDLAISRDPTPLLLLVERRAKTLSPEAFEARRKEWADAWAERVEVKCRPFVWLHAYAAVSETPEDAARALGEQPKYGPIPRYAPWATGDAYVGTTFSLAGRAAEAIPFLRRAAGSCMSIKSPFELTRVNLVLGQAFASLGRRDEACAAYRVVLDHWGAARPRSVTADKARSLAQSIGCPTAIDAAPR
jgi:tRNA A-37 threonylcarbamoyl transferase component Bud32/tetratricopeptide (TPR) repeat protein